MRNQATPGILLLLVAAAAGIAAGIAADQGAVGADQAVGGIEHRQMHRFVGLRDQLLDPRPRHPDEFQAPDHRGAEPPDLQRGAVAARLRILLEVAGIDERRQHAVHAALGAAGRRHHRGERHRLAGTADHSNVENIETFDETVRQVEALDRNGLLSDVTKVLSENHVNILSANLSTTRDRVAKSRFTFEMAETKHLDNVLRAVRNVPGVFDAYRVVPRPPKAAAANAPA